MSLTQNSKVAGYNLELPDRSYAISSLITFIGKSEAESLWQKVCRQAKFSEYTTKPEELEVIFNHIAKEPGSVGVVGKSMVVRAITYKLLKGGKNG